jgi:hypothetical protein
MKYSLLLILLAISVSCYSQQDTTKKNIDIDKATEIAPPPPSAHCTSFPHLRKSEGGDILIWNGDTMKMFSKPIFQSKIYDSLIKEYFPHKRYGFSKVWTYDYIAEWIMLEDELYLSNLYIFTSSYNCRKLDLRELFGEDCKEGKVKADWVSQTLNIIDGECIHFIKTVVQSIYEKEFMLTFQNGVLIETKEYDNTKSFKSYYTENRDSLKNFIHSNINWSLIPDLGDKKMRVFFSIHNGVDSVSILLNRDSVSNEIVQELIRVIKSIPHWNVYYKRGEYYSIKFRWTVLVYLDEETRKKYGR